MDTVYTENRSISKFCTQQKPGIYTPFMPTDQLKRSSVVIMYPSVQTKLSIVSVISPTKFLATYLLSYNSTNAYSLSFCSSIRPLLFYLSISTRFLYFLICDPNLTKLYAFSLPVIPLRLRIQNMMTACFFSQFIVAF